MTVNTQHIIPIFKFSNKHNQYNIRLCIVDQEDLQKVQQHKWTIDKDYAFCKKIGEYMHRLVMDCSKYDKKAVDHLNHNGFNNSKLNLIKGTNQENLLNIKKKINADSKYFGVSRKHNKWNVEYNRHSYGSYDDEEEAARVYDQVVLYFDNNNNRRLNFKDSKPFEQLPKIKRQQKRDDDMLYIYPQKKYNNYVVQLKVNKKIVRIGLFDNLTEAKKQRDQAMIKYNKLTKNQQANDNLSNQSNSFLYYRILGNKQKLKKTLLSEEDIDSLRDKVLTSNENGYVLLNTKVQDKKVVQKIMTLQLYVMQRMGIQLKNNEVIDHINGIKDDNRRSNLRPATYPQNGHNTKKKNINRKSDYIGVYVTSQKENKYFSSVVQNNKPVYLGTYQDQKSAAIARDLYCIQQYGEYAKLNNVDCTGYTLINNCLFYKGKQISSVKKNKNKYTGVRYCQTRQKFVAEIHYKGRLNVGAHKQEQFGAIARQLKIKQLDLEGKVTMNDVDTRGYTLNDKNKLYYEGKPVQE